MIAGTNTLHPLSSHNASKICLFWILTFYDFCSPWTWLAFKMKSPAEDLIKSKPWVVLNCAKLKLISTWAELKLTCLPQFPFLALHHCIHSSAVLLHKAAALCCTSLTHSMLHCIALQPSLCTVLPTLGCSSAQFYGTRMATWPLPSFSQRSSLCKT